MSEPSSAASQSDAKVARQLDEEEDQHTTETTNVPKVELKDESAGVDSSTSSSTDKQQHEEEVEATIVDVRPLDDFLKAHLKGSVSFELATLGVGGGDNTRATELPSRSWPNVLMVMGRDSDETVAGLDWLETRGWQVDRTKSVAADSMNWEEALKSGKAESGQSLCRFWRASPPLERALRQVTERVQEQRRLELADLDEPNLIKSKSELWALDLGCGSGRDAVFLAQRGWHVLCVDREESFLGKLQSFAVRQGVGHLITTKVADLRPQNVNWVLGEILTERKFDLIHLSRFMNRPLLAFLVQNIPKRSYVAIHHFLVGAQSRHGRPFRKGSEQTLEKGELSSDFFKAPDYEILMEEESALADGRPVTNFVAKRN